MGCFCRGDHWSPAWLTEGFFVQGFFSACGEITTKSCMESVACDGMESPQAHGITQRVYKSGALDDPFGLCASFGRKSVSISSSTASGPPSPLGKALELPSV